MFGASGKPLPSFPFLFGGTFIEAGVIPGGQPGGVYFPSFSEGLSLRPAGLLLFDRFPGFPFLFGGTFIEAEHPNIPRARSAENFPSFSEGLSLRLEALFQS